MGLRYYLHRSRTTTNASLLLLHKNEHVLSLMKRAGEVNINSKTYARLEEISNNRGIRQRFTDQTGLFRVSILNEGLAVN